MVFEIPVILSSAFPTVWKGAVAQMSLAKTGTSLAALKGSSILLSKSVTSGKSGILASTSAQLDSIKQTAQKIIDEIEQGLSLNFLLFHLDEEETAGYCLMKKREEYEKLQYEEQNQN